EVQRNAERRRLYQQYCRMQKACKMLAVDFHPESVTGAAGPEKVVVAFETAANRRSPMRGFYAVGAVAAAAACVALILTGRGRLGVPDSQVTSQDRVAIQAPAVTAPRTELAPTAAEPSRTTPAPTGIVQRPMLVGDPLFLAGRAQVD